MTEKSSKNNSKLKEIKLNTIIYGTLAFVVALIVFGAIFIYRFNESRIIPNYIYNKVFYPAVIIDGDNFITIGEINQNLLSVRKFYESQDFSSLGLRFDFTTEDGKKRLKIREKELINKMIEDKIIEMLAKERGIKITDKMVSSNVDRKMDEYGNEEAIRENLNNLYGWEIDDFEDKIVKPSLYKDELEKWLGENDGKEKNENSKNEANATIKKIKEKGDNFDAVAKNVSEEKNGNTGGKLGWFKEEQISKDIRKEVVALKDGENSDVLESNLGYHIIRMDDIKASDDNNKIYNISQIFFPKISFASWLDKQIKEKKLWVLLNEYKWNNENGLIEFKNKEMEKFEAESLNKAEKDASLMAF